MRLFEVNEGTPSPPHHIFDLLLSFTFYNEGTEVVYTFLGVSDSHLAVRQLDIPNSDHSIYLITQAGDLVLQLLFYDFLLPGHLIKNFLCKDV